MVGKHNCFSLGPCCYLPSHDRRSRRWQSLVSSVLKIKERFFNKDLFSLTLNFMVIPHKRINPSSRLLFRLFDGVCCGQDNIFPSFKLLNSSALRFFLFSILVHNSFLTFVSWLWCGSSLGVPGGSGMGVLSTLRWFEWMPVSLHKLSGNA